MYPATLRAIARRKFFARWITRRSRRRALSGSAGDSISVEQLEEIAAAF
jgi:hypothetical protein